MVGSTLSYLITALTLMNITPQDLDSAPQDLDSAQQYSLVSPGRIFRSVSIAPVDQLRELLLTDLIVTVDMACMDGNICTRLALMRDSYNFDDDILEDLLWVWARTGVDMLTLGSIVDRESSATRGAVNYCKVWGKPFYNEKKGRWEKKCDKGGSCHKNCRQRREVWKNHLDVGLWQTRDVVERVGGPEGSRRWCGWSWLRKYRYVTGDKVGPDCALDRYCSRKLVVFVINTLQEYAPKIGMSCGKRDPLPSEFQWLIGWNGCGSARNHVKRTEVLRLKADHFNDIRETLYDLMGGLKLVVQDSFLGSIIEARGTDAKDNYSNDLLPQIHLYGRGQTTTF